jgi:HSP20 family protein
MAKELVKSTDFFPTFSDDFFRPWNDWFYNGNFPGKLMNVPAVNITESKDNYTLKMAVPGMKKDDFKIDVGKSMLTISAEKEEEKEEQNKRYNRREYNYSSFSRSFTLPDEVKYDDIQASYENGVLSLLLPKKEDAKKSVGVRHVAVK